MWSRAFEDNIDKGGLIILIKEVRKAVVSLYPFSQFMCLGKLPIPYLGRSLEVYSLERVKAQALFLWVISGTDEKTGSMTKPGRLSEVINSILRQYYSPIQLST